MKRFHLIANFKANASDVETLLSDAASHFAAMSRHVGNGRPIENVCALFQIEEVKVDEAAEAAALAKDPDFDDGTVDLKHDHIVDEHGPIALTLDPDSAAGKAHAEQLSRETSEREQRKLALAKDSRTDAENLALHSDREQAAHASK